MVGSLGAQDRPLVGDRPDFTESAETIELGHVQLETGATFSGGESDALEVGEALFRIGLSRSWELRVGVGSWVDVSSELGDAHGVSDASLGLKVKLFDAAGARPDFAVLVGASLPTGSSELTDDRAVPELKLAASWPLSDDVGVGANVGWARAVDGSQRYDELSWSLAVGLDLRGDWACYGELYGFSKEGRGGDPTLYADGGVTRQVHANLQLDARLGFGLEDGGGESHDWLVGFGAVVRW